MPRIAPSRLETWRHKESETHATVGMVRGPSGPWWSDLEPQLYEALKEALGQGVCVLFDPEVLSYTTGGALGAHYDRPRRVGPEGSPDSIHIGTLLCVSGEGVQGGHLKGIDSGKVLTPSDAVSHIVYIPLSEKHQVTDLEKGHRVVAKASVACVVA